MWSNFPCLSSLGASHFKTKSLIWNYFSFTFLSKVSSSFLDVFSLYHRLCPSTHSILQSNLFFFAYDLVHPIVPAITSWLALPKMLEKPPQLHILIGMVTFQFPFFVLILLAHKAYFSFVFQSLLLSSNSFFIIFTRLLLEDVGNPLPYGS